MTGARYLSFSRSIWGIRILRFFGTRGIKACWEGGLSFWGREELYDRGNGFGGVMKWMGVLATVKFATLEAQPLDFARIVNGIDAEDSRLYRELP